MITPKRLLSWAAGVLIGMAVLVYAADWGWFEYRMGKRTASDPLETVTVYYATDVKGGKVEIFDAQPVTETCVHAIFWHQGYSPCWRLNRSHIKRVSRIMPPKKSRPSELLVRVRPRDLRMRLALRP